MNGLHSCKPGNEPQVGQVKTFLVEQRTSASGKDWTKIKNAMPDQGGSPYKITAVKPTGHEDSYGNLSFNLDIEPSTDAPQPRQNPTVRVVTNGGGRDDARHHLMRVANLLKLCHDAARAVLGPDYDGEDARSMFIEASRAGYVDTMPDKPMTNGEPEPQVNDDAPPPNEEESF